MTEAHDRPATVSPADRRALRGAKRALRRAVSFRRRTVTPEQRATDDARRTRRVQEFVGDRLGPDLVTAAYVSTDDEPGTLELISWLHATDTPVWLPVLGTEDAPLPDDDSGRTAVHWSRYAGADRLRLGRHGIAEPDGTPHPADAVADCRLIIVAGLAGSADGARLGRGSGWYDRALPHAPHAVTVLLLDDDEVLDVVPTEPDDVAVDVIITPTRSIVCGER